MIMFVNLAISEHDFTMDHPNGTEEWVHMHLADNTAGMKMSHVQLPNEDVTIPFWCSVLGHRDAGMEGEIIVGEGSPDDSDDSSIPCFGIFSAFIGLLSILIVAKKLRRK